MKDKASEMTVPFEVINCGSISEEMSLRLYSQLISAKKDTVQIEFREGELSLKEGEMCYISPMTEYSVQGGEALVIRFDLHALEVPAPYINKVYPILGEKSSTKEKFFLTSPDEARNIADISQKLSEVKDIYSYSAYLLIQQLVLRLTENRPSTKTGSYIDRIGAYIDAHSAYQLEAVMLARMCGMSYPNFAKRFNERYGRSCKEHITHVRVARARRLLKNTALDISDIAAECGFFDSSHFIRTYKKKLGVTPNRDRGER